MPIPRRSLGLLAGAAATRWALGPPRSAGAAPVAAVADMVGGAKTDLPTPALARLVALKERFAAAGLPAEILSGGSTGTWDIDSTVPELTELQCGSYVAMDAECRGIGGPTGDVCDAFAPALGVLVTVVSTSHAGRATVDGGFKAFATDRPIGPVCRDLPAVAYRFRGDEFGILSRDDGPPPVRRGDRVEPIPPDCDPTVNLDDRIHACRGDGVEAVWSVTEPLACGGADGP